MRNFGKQIVSVLSFIFITTTLLSQEPVKIEFKNSIKSFKDLMASNNYELKLHQNTYVYDLVTPIETSSQHFVQNGDKFYYHSDGIIMISEPDYRVIIDSNEKTIHITDVTENPQSMNFMFDDSTLNKVDIEKKELKDMLIYNVDMYSLNLGMESVQYHFNKTTNLLEKVIIYYKEGHYYEDQNHLNENQFPVIEVVINKIISSKFIIPEKEDFIIKRKDDYIAAPSYRNYIINDTRQKL